MLANNNLKVCWTLVRRDFRFHRVKNAVLALAVALVTGLYAFVFLLGGAVEDAFLLNYQYTYGSTSHMCLGAGVPLNRKSASGYSLAVLAIVSLPSVISSTNTTILKETNGHG